MDSRTFCSHGCETGSAELDESSNKLTLLRRFEGHALMKPCYHDFKMQILKVIVGILHVSMTLLHKLAAV